MPDNSSTTEIILAKIAPLFVLLSLMALFGIVIMKVVFNVPFHWLSRESAR